MKKIRILTISLVVTLVAGASIFYACEKEKITDNLLGPTTNNSMVKDYDAYIEDLIASTGIDIHVLSQLEEVQKVADKQVKMMNAATATLQTKGQLTEEKAAQIQRLAQSMQIEYDKGNHTKVLTLYESLCAICMSIDGFMSGVNEHGLQTVTYDPDKDPFLLPVTYMETEKSNAVALVKAIETTTPQFAVLPSPVKVEVVAATLYLNIQSAPMIRGLNLADVAACKKSAKTRLVVSLTAATALYITGAALCTGTFIAILACEGVAYAGYITATTGAISLHKSRVRLCELQGYF